MQTGKQEFKYCPRCGGEFNCLREDIAHCQCSAIDLCEPARQYLKTRYQDCLCGDCLVQVNRETQEAMLQALPTQKERLLEGLHYYKEGELWVFTEFYHLQRGYCCQKGCRHCAYGFKK